MKCECCMDCYELDICNDRCNYKCDVCSFSPNKENNFEIVTYKIEQKNSYAVPFYSFAEGKI